MRSAAMGFSAIAVAEIQGGSLAGDMSESHMDLDGEAVSYLGRAGKKAIRHAMQKKESGRHIWMPRRHRAELALSGEKHGAASGALPRMCFGNPKQF